jgi:hypothetical protein
MTPPPVSVTLRPARAHERSALSDLCLRSKGYWGYDAAFLEACREELSVTEVDTGDLMRVAEVGGALAGVVQIAEDAGKWHLQKLFVDPASRSPGG